jgi:hypothetical protein
MALSKIDAANFLDGTLPDTNINNASLDNVTGLPAGVGGKVLQVVTATDTTQRNTTSTSFVTASNTLSVNITPSSSSNKIFLTTTFASYNNNTGKSMGATIFRDSTDIGNGTWGLLNRYDDTGRTIGASTALTVLDSPSSTSEITYQVYFKTESGGNAYFNYDGTKSSITAFEIAG